MDILKVGLIIDKRLYYLKNNYVCSLVVKNY